MPQYERGPYEPSDEVRIFDGSEDDEDSEGSRLPLLIVLSLLVLAMFGCVVWMAYSYGVVHGRTEPRVLVAESGPARIAPANPGGAETPYKGFKIYEQPAPADDEADSTPPPAAATPAPAAATPAPAAEKPAMAEQHKVVAPPVQAVVPPAPKAPPKVVKAPAVVPKPVAPARTETATAPPAALDTPVAKPPPAKVAASGSYVLQIGAYKSQADADAAWRTYKAKHAALLSGYSQDVQKADLGDKGTWYRLRIAGFPSKDVAGALCERLKADGGGCFLGR